MDDDTLIDIMAASPRINVRFTVTSSDGYGTFEPRPAREVAQNMLRALKEAGYEVRPIECYDHDMPMIECRQRGLHASDSEQPLSTAEQDGPHG